MALVRVCRLVCFSIACAGSILLWLVALLWVVIVWSAWLLHMCLLVPTGVLVYSSFRDTVIRVCLLYVVSSQFAFMLVCPLVALMLRTAMLAQSTRAIGRQFLFGSRSVSVPWIFPIVNFVVCKCSLLLRVIRLWLCLLCSCVIWRRSDVKLFMYARVCFVFN